MLVVVKQGHVAGERLQYRVIIAAGCFEATWKTPTPGRYQLPPILLLFTHMCSNLKRCFDRQPPKFSFPTRWHSKVAKGLRRRVRKETSLASYYITCV